MRGNSRRLTEELRAIKDRSGLSLTQVGARTHYSKASWERWFNGKRLITEQALESLAVAVDENARLLRPLLEQALRETETDAPLLVEPAAVSAPAAPAAVPAAAPVVAAPAVAAVPVSPMTAEPAAPAPGPDPVRTGGWRRHLRTALVSALSALVGAAVGAYVAAPGSQSTGTRTPSAASTLPPCTGSGCSGRDPQSTGCVKDDKTLTTGHVGKIIIYLHYSARCHAAWGALTNAGPGDFATIITTSGERQQALVHWGYDNYSMMVDASDSTIGLKVCGTPQSNLHVAVCTPEFTAPTS
ncbi:helix-turn-helix domain-containing protein [Streptacidiphilus melanogenes]|uniref:helix-turn-helix domain-containing protein n=1 Tax=Streptacidiphilus melanogenes TaxID=411235 RepID=UPI0005A891FA|nr:XRE family transcriptional regulator [Streptacidiphilus melanogenes]